MDVFQVIADGLRIFVNQRDPLFAHISNFYLHAFVLIFLTAVFSTHILWERKKRWPSISRLAAGPVVAAFNLWMITQSLFLLLHMLGGRIQGLYHIRFPLVVLSAGLFLLWLVMLHRAPRMIKGTDNDKARYRDLIIAVVLLVAWGLLLRFQHGFFQDQVSYFEDPFSYEGLVLPTILFVLAFRTRHSMPADHPQKEHVETLGSIHVAMAAVFMLLTTMTWIHFELKGNSVRHGIHLAPIYTSLLGSNDLIVLQTVLMIAYNIWMSRLDLLMGRMDQPDALYSRAKLNEQERRITTLMVEGRKPGRIANQLMMKKKDVERLQTAIRNKFSAKRDRDVLDIVRGAIVEESKALLNASHPEPKTEQKNAD